MHARFQPGAEREWTPLPEVLVGVAWRKLAELRAFGDH
jgi:hypothetical protein